MQWERMFVRAQVAVLAVGLLCAATWGPQRVISFVLGAGPPNAGERVPRQLPYRGYLEQNGAPVSAPSGLELGFTLFPSDGGTGWRTTAVLPVVNGHFAVDLGDDGGVPAYLLDDPGVSLGIQVQPSSSGPVLDGKQRLLSVPFSQRSDFAWNASNAQTANAAIGPLASQLSNLSTQAHQFFVSAPPTATVSHTDGNGIPWTKVDPAIGLTFTPVVSGTYRIQGAVWVSGRNGTWSEHRLNVSSNQAPATIAWQPLYSIYRGNADQETLMMVAYFQLSAGTTYTAFAEYSNTHPTLHTNGIASLGGQAGVMVAELVSIP